MPRPKPHPLEPLVWRALAANGGYLDVGELAQFLIGDDWCTGSSQAYQRVAFDLLNYMQSAGQLKRDAYGWWRKVRLVPQSNGSEPADAGDWEHSLTELLDRVAEISPMRMRTPTRI